MNKKTRIYGVAATAVAVAVVGAASASIGGATAQKTARAQGVDDAVAQVKQALGDGRIVSASAAGSTLNIIVAASDPASTTIARWDAKILARVAADELGAAGQGSVTHATYSDTAGNDVDGGVDAIHADPLAGPLPAGACEAAAQSAPSAVSVVNARTVPLLNGVCLFTLRTQDPQGFAASAPSTVGTMVSGVPDLAAHAYLVEVLDQGGAPQMILGWVPAIGGDEGQGLAWITPGLRSPAVLGSTVGH